jgi:O-antigen ligase
LQFFPNSGIKPIRFGIFATLLFGLALLISQSRSTFLGLGMSLLFLMIMLLKRKRDKVILVSLLILILSISFFSSNFLNDLLGEGVYRANVFNRLKSFGIALQYFLNNPLIGVGHGNATYIVRNTVMVIHNQFLDQFASTGILGGIPLLILYGIFFKSAIKIYRDCQANTEIRGFAIWIIATMIHSFIELMFYRGFYSEHLAWYFSILGILYSARYKYRKITLK